ncbi:hypothetical protein GIB67_010452 [Kingdonia uniflora]|uniref:Protein kinase domain-containing protein n=1 Tax=Kingdonia uniflora TaxID=39325 RepID=A0A7J7MAU8_9MAGN|nr:hypothetical protein GIB67_010452 [Kingdonia uniflora]
MGRNLCSLVCVAIFLTLFFEDCNGKRQNHCNPSSCGNIRNISYPFRLKGDPRRCGNRKYELSCENNRTILHLYSGKYFVNSISYTNFTMRIMDTGLQSGICSSLPRHSLTKGNFSVKDPYKLPWFFDAVVFLNCPFRVESPNYLDSSSCINRTNSSDMYSYVVSGRMPVSDLKDSCIIILTVVTSTVDWEEDTEFWNTSFSDIHQGLLRGIEIEWYNIYCGKCFARGADGCSLDSDNKVICYGYYCLGRLTIHYLTASNKVVTTQIETLLLAVMSNLARVALSEIVGDEIDGSKGGPSIYENYRHEILAWIKKICKMIGFILVGRTLCGILCLLVFLVYKFRRRHLSMDCGIEEFLQGQNNLLPIRYSYSEVKKMTKGFREKLGQGGFGSVFKGKLRSGRFVAVKMLGKSKSNGQDFINEVATIGRIHHVNVVHLTGFCAENSRKALIYDFMPNGSLEKYIFPGNDKNMHLSWEKMYEIALGVAHGIEYLHQGCTMQILHFDIKPHNILLDENFNPRISDFGLAKLYPTDDSIVTLTAARGTIGYIAPELFYKNIGGVSYKADVYSFGMLLMEMAGRRKNLNAHAENSSQIYFPKYVYDQLTREDEMEIEDATEEERKIAKKLAVVALWCIQLKPTDRPSMNKVVEMLESATETLQMPLKLSLVPEERTVATSTESST